MKIIVFLALVAVVTATPYLRVRRQAEDKASEYHHEFEHEHAKSHQSIKFHHFHPVPVYVKKEYVHLLKDPLEKGKSSHGVKQIHPKHEHIHGYGLVLESHNYNHADHGRSDESGFEQASGEIEHKSSEEGQGGWEAAGGQIASNEHQELDSHYMLQYPGFSGYSEHSEGEESY